MSERGPDTELGVTIEPNDLYELFMESPEREVLDLSAVDFGWVAVAFIARGGGSRAEFLEWLSSLTYETAHKIASN